MEKIILGTGSYFNVRTGNTVSIDGAGGRAWGYTGPFYRGLAPRLETSVPYSRKYHELLKLRESVTDIKEYYDFKKKIEDQYIEDYYEIRLKYLDVEELLCTLYNIYGKDIILLGSEYFTDLGPRRLVADYIELKTGIYIPEVSVNIGGEVGLINPTRYKKRLEKIIRRK